MGYDTFEGEAEDIVSPLCTCGQLTTTEMKALPADGASAGKKKSSTWLESSFVHLMTPRGSRNKKNDLSQPNPNQQQQSHGYLEQHQHSLQLLDAAHGCDGVELCLDCIDRVSTALDADTRRLYAEIQAYHDVVDASQQRAKAVQSFTSPRLDLAATEQAYLQEIDMIEKEIRASEEEFVHLSSLFKEQLNISKQLDALDENLQLEQNSLDLQSRAFENRQELLSRTLSEIQLEVDKLSLVALPHTLFDLQVDPRGLRYPLINQLRLAFQPKGDVPADEVRVAWSLATQLLLFLGTLLEYPGQDWKLVPLADCAKLIYRKEIFNLSPGDCRSLMAWNALLDQVVRHAITIVGKTTVSSTTANKRPYMKHNTPTNNNTRNQQYIQDYYHAASRRLSLNSSAPNSPTRDANDSSTPSFVSSPTSIGDTELARLDPSDAFGWSQVIHRMASNLLWLSDRASELAAVQVANVAHCAV